MREKLRRGLRQNLCQDLCLIASMLAIVASCAAQQPDGPQSGAPPAVAPAPPPATPQAGSGETIVVPSGTRVGVVLQNGISTRSAKAGDSVYLQTSFPITSNNRIVIPVGSYLRGELLEAKRPGRIKGRGEFRMRLDTLILPNGYTVDLRAAPRSADSGGKETMDSKAKLLVAATKARRWERSYQQPLRGPGSEQSPPAPPRRWHWRWHRRGGRSCCRSAHPWTGSRASARLHHGRGPRTGPIAGRQPDSIQQSRTISAYHSIPRAPATA